MLEIPTVIPAPVISDEEAEPLQEGMRVEQSMMYSCPADGSRVNEGVCRSCKERVGCPSHAHEDVKEEAPEKPKKKPGF